MAWDLEVILAGPPVGAARPRFVRETGRVYMPPQSTRWEGHAAAMARRAWGKRAPLNEAVEVEVVAVIARPKALSRQADPDGRLPAWRPKPDVDNAAKLAMDALTKAGVIVDDTRVVQLVARKVYAAKGEDCCTEIRLRRVAA